MPFSSLRSSIVLHFVHLSLYKLVIMRGLRHLSVQNEALSKAVSHLNVHFHAKSNSFSYLEDLVLKQRQRPEIMADPVRNQGVYGV